MNYLKLFFFLAVTVLFFGCEKEELTLDNDQDARYALEKSDATDEAAKLGGGREAADAWMYFNKGDNTDYVWHSKSPNGTSWSTSVQLGNGAETKESPEAIMFRNNAYVFYRGQTLQKKIFYSKRGQNTSWGPQGAMENGVNILTGPTPAVLNGRLYVFFVDELSEIESAGGIHYFVSSDGNSFSGPFTISTGFVGDAAINIEELGVVAARDGTLWVFYVETNRRIQAMPCTANSSGILTGGTPINTGDKTKNGLSATFDTRTNEIVYVHTSYSHDNVMERRVSASGSSLNLSSPAVQILGARSSRKPSIKSDNNGNLVVVYRGRKSSYIYWAKYLSSSGSWTGNVRGTGKTSKGMGLVYTGW